MFRNFTSLCLLILGGTVAVVVLSGCAGANVATTKRGGAMTKPDVVVVNDFAVTGAEVNLDRGLMASAMRDNGPRSVNDEENRVGHVVAQKLSETLVDELRKEGINAVRAGDRAPMTPSTVVLKGEFVTIDQGDQTKRVWIGFGLGGSQIRTRVQALQNGELVAQAETNTHSNLKPGMAVSLGAGAAAESGATVAAGAASTGFSEVFLSTVEADARRTAQEIAKKIKDAYVERGWMSR